MRNGANERPPARRPASLTLLLLYDMAYAVLTFTYGPIYVLLYPNGYEGDEQWNQASRISAPIYLALALGICISSIGVWMASARALTALRLWLTLFAAWLLIGSGGRLLDVFLVDPDLRSVTGWACWDISAGLRALLLLALNYWYFRRPRVANFFSR
jgi:hypothetical protein